MDFHRLGYVYRVWFRYRDFDRDLHRYLNRDLDFVRDTFLYSVRHFLLYLYMIRLGHWNGKGLMYHHGDRYVHWVGYMLHILNWVGLWYFHMYVHFLFYYQWLVMRYFCGRFVMLRWR